MLEKSINYMGRRLAVGLSRRRFRSLSPCRMWYDEGCPAFTFRTLISIPRIESWCR